MPSPAIAVAAHGNRLAVSVCLSSDSAQGFVAVFDRIDLKKPFVVLGGHDNIVTALAFGCSGHLCSASIDRVLLWDVDAFVYNSATGPVQLSPLRGCRAQLPAHSSRVVPLADIVNLDRLPGRRDGPGVFSGRCHV